jgi:transcriptional regulator with XRE-family HTH domain
MTKSAPDPVDVYVGARIRQRRLKLGLSQSELAARLGKEGRKGGLSFQQVQKYERGANRVSASMLVRASQALDIPVAWFFEDVPGLDVTDVGPDQLSRATWIASAEGVAWVDAGVSLSPAARVALQRVAGVIEAELAAAREVRPVRQAAPGYRPAQHLGA